jgi:hypothetical protein
MKVILLTERVFVDILIARNPSDEAQYMLS